MTAIFQLLNNKVETFFFLPSFSPPPDRDQEPGHSLRLDTGKNIKTPPASVFLRGEQAVKGEGLGCQLGQLWKGGQEGSSE